MNAKYVIAASLFLLSAAARAAQGEDSPRLPDSPLSTANLVETALGLVLVLGLMLGLAWLVKRYVQVPGMGKGRVNVLGGVSLGAREKAVLLSVEGRRLLVGVAPGQVRALMVLDESAEDAADFDAQLRAVSEGSTERSAGEVGA
jgi:flagellar protein FliO/FliZ